jgi:predicted amidohydrolase YtcJ
MQIPDLILLNGNIRTQCPETPRVQALAAADGRILALGRDEAIKSMAGPDTEVVDLGGRPALPGFIDSHFHYRDWVQSEKELKLAKATSLAELLDKVGQAAARSGGGWIKGQGWNESVWPERRQPTAFDLDRVAPGNPVILWRTDLHMAVANSAALNRAGVTRDTPDPPQGEILRDADGHPDGRLRESAIDLVKKCLPPITDDDLYRLYKEGQGVLHSFGITGLTDVPLMNDAPAGAQSLRVWRRLRRDGELRLRVAAGLPGESLNEAINLGLRTGLGDDFLRIGPLKYFADGGMGARTAWMFEPYLDGGVGMPLLVFDELKQWIVQADEAGLAVMIHAIGDRANHEIIRIFEELFEKRTGRGPAVPHRLEHVQMIRPEDARRLGRLDLVACVQPPNLVVDIDMIDACVGERGRMAYAFRDLPAAGVKTIFSSDAPVCDHNPLAGIHAAVTRQRSDGYPAGGWHPEQKIGVEEAVKAYTLWPALASGMEALGSLAPGKRLDLTVLDRDIYAIPPEGIISARVEMTIVDGRVVFGSIGLPRP